MSEPQVKFFKLKEPPVGAFYQVAKVAYEEMLRRMPVRTGWTSEHLAYVSREDGYNVYATDPAWRVLHLIEYGTTHSAARPFMRPAAAFMKDMNAEAVRDYFKKRVVIE